MTRIQRISFLLSTSKGAKETKNLVFLVFFDVSALRAEIIQILAKSIKSFFPYLFDFVFICLISSRSELILVHPWRGSRIKYGTTHQVAAPPSTLTCASAIPALSTKKIGPS